MKIKENVDNWLDSLSQTMLFGVGLGIALLVYLFVNVAIIAVWILIRWWFG